MSKVRQTSQADAIFAVLADRQWHTTHEIGVALFEQLGTGGVIHSRINDLRRKRGHNILHEQLEGEQGAHAHRYLLVATAAEIAGSTTTVASRESPAAPNSPPEPTIDVEDTSPPSASIEPGWLKRQLDEEEREEAEPPPAIGRVRAANPRRGGLRCAA